MSKIRLGIYGGTFSPPHNGHVESAEAFMREMKLDKLLIIPTFLPPHKEAGDGASPEDRLNMCRIAFSHIPNTEISDMEIRRGGKSYTYMTLEELSNEDTSLFFLCGTDMILTFDLWKKYEYIFSLATICYARRECKEENDSKIKEKIGQYKKLGAEIVEIKHEINEISSSDIREVLSGSSVNPYLPAGVYEYISWHGLYGCTCDSQTPFLEKIKSLMSERRFIHTLGVVKAAEKIALATSPSLVTKARICAFLHDVTKEMKQSELIEKYKINVTDEDMSSPETLHALTAPYYIIENFPDFADADILSAVKTHTTGEPDMALLNEILFVADFIEENRIYDSSTEVREELYQNLKNADKDTGVMALDRAAILSIDKTLLHLESKGKSIHSLTLKTKEALKNRL